MLKSKEIQVLNPEESNNKIKELKEQLIKLNSQIALGTLLKNPGQVKNIKKTIARILTLNTNKLGEEQG